MLLDDTAMESQLNLMRQKANVLKTICQPLDDSLVAIAMVISLPTSYLTLRTILMAADDKLTMDMVINQGLIEERSQKLPGQTVLSAKVTSQTKGKGKAKSGKKESEEEGYMHLLFEGGPHGGCMLQKEVQRSCKGQNGQVKRKA